MRLRDGPAPPGRRIAIVHPFGGGLRFCRPMSEIYPAPGAP
jgi:hypothetical protein